MKRQGSRRAPPRNLATLWTVAFTFFLLSASCGSDGPDGNGFSRRLGSDFVASGSRITISENTPGDVMVASGELEFRGTAGGDLLVAAGEQSIAGEVRGSVRLAGGEISLNTAVARNATIAGGRVDIAPGASIGGNAYLAGGQVNVQGTVGGVLAMNGGTAVLDGTVEGDVIFSGSSLRVGPQARIAGDLRTRAPEGGVTIDPGARISGQVISEIAEPGGTARWFWLVRVVMIVGFLFAGAAVVALLPERTEAAAALIPHRPGAAVGWGFLWLVGVPIVAIILAATLVGIPLALISVAVYLITLYLARAVTAVWLGRSVLGDRAGTGRSGAVVSFLAGAVVIVAIQFVPILGALISLVATVLGLGATVQLFRKAPQPVD